MSHHEILKELRIGLRAVMEMANQSVSPAQNERQQMCQAITDAIERSFLMLRNCLLPF